MGDRASRGENYSPPLHPQQTAAVPPIYSWAGQLDLKSNLALSDERVETPWGEQTGRKKLLPQVTLCYTGKAQNKGDRPALEQKRQESSLGSAGGEEPGTTGGPSPLQRWPMRHLLPSFSAGFVPFSDCSRSSTVREGQGDTGQAAIPSDSCRMNLPAHRVAPATSTLPGCHLHSPISPTTFQYRRRSLGYNFKTNTWNTHHPSLQICLHHSQGKCRALTRVGRQGKAKVKQGVEPALASGSTLMPSEDSLPPPGHLQMPPPFTGVQLCQRLPKATCLLLRGGYHSSGQRGKLGGAFRLASLLKEGLNPRGLLSNSLSEQGELSPATEVGTLCTKASTLRISVLGPEP